MSSDAEHEKKEADEFLMWRDLIFPHFENDQKKAVESIYRVLHPLLIAGHIRTVIDSGCGSGEILVGIATKLKNELEFRDKCHWKPDGKKREITDYKFLGFDRNECEVNKAQEKAKTLNKSSELVTFMQLTLGGSPTSESGELILKIVDRADPHKRPLGWQYVCLIITGHTLPYADVWLRTIQAIREGWTVPKFIFYDICATFDEAIEAINNAGKQDNGEKKYEEPQIILDSKDTKITHECWTILERITQGKVMENVVKAANGKLLFVRCSKSIRDSDKIRRTFDLYVVADGEIKGSGPYELFGEKQMNMKPEAFQDELRASKKYSLRLVEKVSYTGGYTPLVGYLCTLQVWQETVMNNAYLQAVRNLLQEDLFAKGTDPKKYDDWNPLCKLRSLVGVVAIQPFDSYHTYGRYVPISVWRKDGNDLKEDNTCCEDSLLGNADTINRSVILDFTSTPPTPHDHETIKNGSTGPEGRSSNDDTEQIKYLPSPSLRNAILHEGSVSNVRSLANHDQFRFCDFDAETQQIAINEVKGAVDQQRDFFILPVFYGTLPLFCLIFNFSEIPTNIIRQETYDLMLTSIRSLVKSKLTEAKLKSFLVRFASEAINTFVTMKADTDDAFAKNSQTRKMTSDETRKVLEKYFKMVLNKPWYSWADMVPTKRVIESLVAQEENDVLGKVWNDALKAAFADPFLKCFIWLKNVHFFEDDPALGNGNGHARTINLHVDRVNELLTNIHLDKDSLAGLVTDDADWMNNDALKVFTWADKGDVRKDPHVEWLFKMLNSIKSKHDCDLCSLASSTDCNKKGLFSQQDVDFNKLKGVWRGGDGGASVFSRFSVWGVLGWVEMYGGPKVVITSDDNSYVNRVICCSHADAFFSSDGKEVDFCTAPSDRIEELRKCLLYMLPIVKVKQYTLTIAISKQEASRSSSCEGTVAVDFKLCFECSVKNQSDEGDSTRLFKEYVRDHFGLEEAIWKESVDGELEKVVHKWPLLKKLVVSFVLLCYKKMPSPPPKGLDLKKPVEWGFIDGKSFKLTPEFGGNIT